MTKNDLQNKIIRTYGFEHKVTISFFKLCAKSDNMWLLNAVTEFYERHYKFLA